MKTGRNHPPPSGRPHGVAVKNLPGAGGNGGGCLRVSPRACMHTSGGLHSVTSAVRLQSCMCAWRKRRGYNLPATATSSSYILGDVPRPPPSPSPPPSLSLSRRAATPSYSSLGSPFRPPRFSPFAPVNFRAGGRRESRATNEFPAAFESRPSDCE